MVAWLRLKFVQLLWPSTAMKETGACANRKWHRGMAGPIEVTVTYRDTRQEDGYSRVELLLMLETVREHERRQGWKVPEPRVEPPPPQMCLTCGYPDVAHGRNIYACGRFKRAP